jgi:hypothetical protein
MVIPRPILLRMRNISDKICTENQGTHFIRCFFSFFENRAAYELMWKHTVESDRPQVTKQYGACALNTR